MKCDHCHRDATVHLAERRGGRFVSLNLCEACAWVREGLGFPRPRTKNELERRVVVKYAPGSRHAAD
jgi:protein-arginine kinase activator protein McsA